MRYVHSPLDEHQTLQQLGTDIQFFLMSTYTVVQLTNFLPLYAPYGSNTDYIVFDVEKHLWGL